MLVNKHELSDALGVSERYITSLVTAGVLPPRKPGGFDLLASVKGYIAYLKQPVAGDLKHERTRVTKLKGDLLDLEFKQRSGELVLRRAVADERFKTGRQVRDNLQNIPARAAGLVAAESDQGKCFEILEREVRQALEALVYENKEHTDPDPIP